MAKRSARKDPKVKGKYLLKVRLVEPNLLDVEDEQEQNRIDKDPSVQEVTWQLQDAPGFYFPEFGAEGGFTWIVSEKPTKPFKGLAIGADRRSVILKVTHRSDLSNGEWRYMLRVTNGAKTYSTTVSKGRLVTINNPVIINR